MSLFVALHHLLLSDTFTPNLRGFFISFVAQQPQVCHFRRWLIQLFVNWALIQFWQTYDDPSFFDRDLICFLIFLFLKEPLVFFDTVPCFVPLVLRLEQTRAPETYSGVVVNVSGFLLTPFTLSGCLRYDFSNLWCRAAVPNLFCATDRPLRCHG